MISARESMAAVTAGAANRASLWRLVGAAFGALGVLALAYGLVVWFSNGAFPGDTSTYYLAGLRLDQGGSLYDLRPTDVWLFDRPEFPLFGPPLIAAPWRLLAMLPVGWGMIVWLVAMMFVGLWAVFWIVLGTRGWGGLLVLALVPSLTLLLGVGNVDALILLGVIAAWPLAAARRDRPLGILIGVLVSIKLTPAVLLIWLLFRRRWTALAWATGTMLVLAFVAAIAAGPGIWFRYIEVMRDGATAGHTAALGILVLGFIAMFLLRHRPQWSFAIAIVLIPIGSPQAAGHSWAMLLGALAPWATWSPGDLATVKASITRAIRDA